MDTEGKDSSVNSVLGPHSRLGDLGVREHAVRVGRVHVQAGNYFVMGHAVADISATVELEQLRLLNVLLSRFPSIDLQIHPSPLVKYNSLTFQQLNVGVPLE